MTPNLDDIWSALAVAHRMADERVWSARGIDYDAARATRDAMQRAVQAFDQLCAQLRDGKRHIEPPADRESPTSCYCSATSHPPCGFCESGAGGEP